jgi:3-oxoadipate enol-lactonase
MHSRIYGDGTAVLLLHGMPSTTADLVPLAEALARSHRVLLPDLPGYGRSPRLEPYTLDAVQRAIESLLAAHAIERTAVVGFSGGAYRALRLALDRRVEVTRIACIGATPGPGPEEADGLRHAAQDLRAGADFHGVAVARFLSPRWQNDASAIAAVQAWMSAAPGDVLAAELDALADAGDIRPELPRLRIPLLLRVGESDVATPPALSRDIAAAVSDAKLEIVAGAGHALLIEDAAATIESVRSFLDDA